MTSQEKERKKLACDSYNPRTSSHWAERRCTNDPQTRTCRDATSGGPLQGRMCHLPICMANAGEKAWKSPGSAECQRGGWMNPDGANHVARPSRYIHYSYLSGGRGTCRGRSENVSGAADDTEEAANPPIACRPCTITSVVVLNRTHRGLNE